MKRVVALLAGLTLVAMVYGQAPDGFKYQAVARKAGGEVIANQAVALRVSILAGSATGAPVCIEAFRAVTNEFGLVNLEIGSINHEDFVAIDWSAGTFFVKIEMDPAGGGDFIEMGTSQILSVPYALHAKTAENANETDPFFTGSAAAGITVKNINAWNDAAVYRHYPGEFFGGGVVFWVDHTGQHGLIVSLADQSDRTAWSNITNISAGATSMWNGSANTDAIIAQRSHTASAAKLCKDYVSGPFDDWYLPSIDELILLCDARYIVDKALDSDGNANTKRLSPDEYWSSTEGSASTAMVFMMDFHNMYPDVGKDSNTRYVRAISAF